MMSRKFSNREKILLVILAVLLVLSGYYLLVAEPVAQTIREAGLRREDAESLLIIEQARANRLRQMEAELDALRADDSAALAEIPDYDNVQSVVRSLNAALAGAERYDLVFRPVTFSGHIASRAIDMSFTCWSYDTAKTIIRQLYDAPYRCQITAVSFLSAGDSTNITAGELSVKLTITFFEYTPLAAAADQ